MGGKRIEVKRKVTFATDMTAIAVGVVACVVVMITLQSHKPYIHGATKDPSHAPLQCLTHFTTKNDTHVFMFQGTIETRADKRETLRVPLAKLLKIGDIITADTSVTLESILQHMNTSLCHDTVNAQLFSRKTHVKAEAQCVFVGMTHARSVGQKHKIASGECYVEQVSSRGARVKEVCSFFAYVHMCAEDDLTECMPPSAGINDFPAISCIVADCIWHIASHLYLFVCIVGHGNSGVLGHTICFQCMCMPAGSVCNW